MANNFIKFDGNNIGKSLVEAGAEKLIKKIYILAEQNNCHITIPIDFAVSKHLMVMRI